MKIFFLTVFIVGALAVSLVAIYATHAFMAPGPLRAAKSVDIPKGTGIVAMANTLQSQSVISDAYVFILFSRLTGTYKTLQAGEYEFGAGTTTGEVLAKISRGDIVRRSFTIPEGKTSFEVIQSLNAVPGLKGEIADIPPEGSLLPSTYDYKSSDTKSALIRRAQENLRGEVMMKCGYLHDALDWDAIHKMSFDDFMDAPCPEDNANWTHPNMQPTIRNVLTLASIVEKETALASERKTIAGVFLNRLKINMPLQTDPTVIYGITRGRNKNEGQGPLGRRLLTSDLQTPGPYNTYLNAGLPPGPIANAGLESIEAVLVPEENGHLFFVADGKGGHVFAATLGEHNRNVAKWRRIRQENR